MAIKYRYQWYQKIYDSIPKIHEEARKEAVRLGLDKLKNKIGLYSGSSSCPGGLPQFVLDAIIAANKTSVLPMRKVEDELREVIKDVYGDDYDGAAVNTCETALRVCVETLFAPPALRRDSAYRGRFIIPYEEDYDFMPAYGRPFPPKYKNLFVDRTVSAGELGIDGKCVANLDSVMVRLVGTKYECHGIRFNPVPLMTRTDAAKSAARIAEVAERHAGNLVGFGSLGYDTPGYGYGERDEDDVPLLKKLIGNLAEKYDVPYLIDSASCLPVIGLSPKGVNADVMVWSMDKPGRAPISGLIVGKEEVMVPIRKGLGLGGQRYGELSSHGKAVFSFADPGRDAVVGLTAFLKMLRDNPDKIKKPIDRFYDILVEEFQSFKPARFRDKLIIVKSYTMGGSELNYEQTWDDGGFGIPIFTLEDLVANTNPISSAMEEMGLYPGTIYSGSVFLSPGLGTLDGNADLNEEYTRMGVKGLVKCFEIVCKHAGLGD